MTRPLAAGRPDVDESRNPWTLRATRPVYDNAWISVRHDEVTDPSGRDGIYGVMSPKNLALGVLPFFDDATTLLVGQYRYALGRYSWEMPEGGGAPGVPMRESVARELREETGCTATSWHHLYDRATLSNSVTDEIVHIWLAWDLTIGDAEPESTEELALWRLPFEELVQLVWDSTVHDSMTCMTVARVEAMRHRRELPERLASILA